LRKKFKIVIQKYKFVACQVVTQIMCRRIVDICSEILPQIRQWCILATPGLVKVFRYCMTSRAEPRKISVMKELNDSRVYTASAAEKLVNFC
jgi:hypothetical protein